MLLLRNVGKLVMQIQGYVIMRSFFHPVAFKFPLILTGSFFIFIIKFILTNVLIEIKGQILYTFSALLSFLVSEKLSASSLNFS